MNHKKYKKFKKMKEKLWAGASGGLLAGMMLVSANTAFAQVPLNHRMTEQYTQDIRISGKTSAMHTMRRWNSVSRINSLASQLGITSDEIKAEIKSGKTIKQILLEKGFDTSQLGTF